MCSTRTDVNRLLGDIVKVTPPRSALATLYLLNRKIKCEDVLERGDEIDFPNSVKDLFAGRLGLPHHGCLETWNVVRKASKRWLSPWGHFGACRALERKIA